MNLAVAWAKVCCTCGQAKPFAEYSRNKRNPDGLGARCKECSKAHCREWFRNNRERHAELGRRWQQNNPERAAAVKAASWARWKAKPGNAERMKASNREKMRSPERRMARSLWGVLRGRKQGRRWSELLGYSEADLRAHLERQFTKGMTWENYGQWHIDHIVPLDAFTITGPECPELKRAWGLPNLRPLWARENLSKGPRVKSLL